MEPFGTEIIAGLLLIVVSAGLTVIKRGVDGLKEDIAQVDKKVGEINGNVRNHSNRLVRLETKAELNPPV